jgi:DNA-3-methyladenine glycosylase II
MSDSALTVSRIKDAESHLRKFDPVMASLIRKHGPCYLSARRGTAFHTLATSIIGQQLSSKAAASLVRRVSTVASRPFRPKDFSALTPETLRAVGLSLRKASCLIMLADRMTSGDLALARLRHLDNEQVIEELTTIVGIGRWTAEMFLIFGVGRPNILSLADAGLQRSARSLYGEDASLEQLGLLWSPWNSVASWYLWRHLD